MSAVKKRDCFDKAVLGHQPDRTRANSKIGKETGGRRESDWTRPESGRDRH